MATLKFIKIGCLWLWKIQQEMQDDAIRTARIPWSPFHRGNRAKVFIWQNFQPDRNLGNRTPRPLIWTHRKFFKGFIAKARSRKPGPYEEGPLIFFFGVFWVIIWILHFREYNDTFSPRCIEGKSFSIRQSERNFLKGSKVRDKFVIFDVGKGAF